MKPAGWHREVFHKKLGKTALIGIDEVGRGCWAGPLVSVAYRFFVVPTKIDVVDSKTIPEAKRIALAQELKTLGDFAIGEVTAQEIDTLGLTVAQLLSYQRAIDGLPSPPDLILLDGRPVKWIPKLPTRPLGEGCGEGPLIESIIDGDALVASIAAASIIAKVHRDTYMKTIAHDLFPNHGFNNHVGYGTKQHQKALAEHGLTPLHRKSYKPIAKYIN